MTTALLTGAQARTSPLAQGLRSPGRDVIVADDGAGIAALTARLPRRSVGVYVQLARTQPGRTGPGLTNPGRTDPAGWSWAPAVTDRIETVALVAPLLAPHATVVLVADDPDDPARDQRVADGLCLLAGVALGRGPDDGGTVSVVREGSPEAVRRALHRDAPEGWPAAPLAAIGAERDYADWRTDVYNLASTSDVVTYFGWLNADSEPRIGLLRGSVISPLAVPADRPVSWGEPGPAALALGHALLADAGGTGPDADDGLVELFVKDVIAPLPASGFELSAAEIAAWLRRHRAGEPRRP